MTGWISRAHRHRDQSRALARRTCRGPARLAKPMRAFTFWSLQPIESLSMQWPGCDGLPAGIWRCGDPLVGYVRPPNLFRRVVRVKRGDGGASERDKIAAASKTNDVPRRARERGHEDTSTYEEDCLGRDQLECRGAGGPAASGHWV